LTDPTRPRKLLKGHETIIFDNQNQMYTVTDTSKLIHITNIQSLSSSSSQQSSFDKTAEMIEIAYLGNGRPLGGKFDRNGILYLADAVQGLIRVIFPKKKSSKPMVELVASRVQLEDGTWSPILFADDLTIGPKTGMIYFTDGESFFCFFF